MRTTSSRKSHQNQIPHCAFRKIITAKEAQVKVFVLVCLFVLNSQQVFAMGSGKAKAPTQNEILDPGEPAYCDPKTFLEKESKIDTSGMSAAHQFKLGDSTLLGVGVGNSDADALTDYATTNSTAGKSSNYCTWYYNEGNDDAENLFNHIYLTNPKDLTSTTGPREYSSKLKNQFADTTNSFITCLNDHKYIALGCNGMKHRGPTVFGMILAYSGCKPERASKVVNVVWGLNGVDEQVRLAIIREGKNLGDQNPSHREKLQQLLGHR